MPFVEDFKKDGSTKIEWEVDTASHYEDGFENRQWAVFKAQYPDGELDNFWRWLEGDPDPMKFTGRYVTLTSVEKIEPDVWRCEDARWRLNENDEWYWGVYVAVMTDEEVDRLERKLGRSVSTIDHLPINDAMVFFRKREEETGALYALKIYVFD